jgi:type IV pilus assembly protein PilQ
MLGKRFVGKLNAIGLLLVAGTSSALAENVIENVTASKQAGSIVLRIKLKDTPAQPAVFSITGQATGGGKGAAPRIALDFSGTSSKLSRDAIKVQQGNLSSVSVVQAGDRSRVVLNLVQTVGYHTAIEGNDVVVTLEEGANVMKPAPTQATKTEFGPMDSSSAKAIDVRNVQFKVGSDGEALLLVDLSDASAGVNVQRKGGKLFVEFNNAKLPTDLKKYRDVEQFRTPIKTYDIRQVGNKVLVEVEPKKNTLPDGRDVAWEHNAYQADNQFVLEVKNLKPDTHRQAGGDQVYRGEKLSLNFQNVDVRAVLQVIAEFTSLNIVASDTVSGNITLRLKDVPWDQALDIVLKSKNLGFRKQGSVLRVAPLAELSEEDKVLSEEERKREDSAPLREERIQLNYTDAIAVIKLFKNDGGSGGGASGGNGNGGGGGSGVAYQFLSSRGVLIGDGRTNQIFIRDTAARIDAFRRMISSLDVPVRQVQIEARIVEASEGFGRDLGIRINAGKSSQGGRQNYGGRLTPSTASGNLSDVRSSMSPSIINFPVLQNASSLAVSLLSAAGTSLFELELSASEGEKQSRILSRPIVVTSDNNKAVFKDGQKVAFEKSTSSGATSIEFEDVVLGLEVTPQITPDGNINLSVEVKKEDLDFYDLQKGARINTRLVNTKVLVENGGTVILGGVYTQQDDKSTTKTPLLGDIPVIGNLFKTTSVKKDKKELLIFITPRILTNAVSDAANSVVNRSY